MAKATSKSPVSLIAMLARARGRLFQDAVKETDGILTPRQLEELNALNLIIARSSATSKADVEAQVTVALEMVELYSDGCLGAGALDAVHAALQSASVGLSATRRRAA